MDFSLKVLALVCVVALKAFQANCQPIEIRTYHDDQKSLVKEIYFISDKESALLNGPYKSFFINGGLEKEGFYTNNVPDSTWTYYYESGVKKMKGELKQGTNAMARVDVNTIQRPSGDQAGALLTPARAETRWREPERKF